MLVRRVLQPQRLLSEVVANAEQRQPVEQTAVEYYREKIDKLTSSIYEFSKNR